MDRRLITPAEAALLLAPSGRTAAQCVQAGLLSLIDAGRIELDDATGPFANSALVLTTSDTSARATLPAHIEALARALEDHGKGPRRTGNQIIHALQRAFGMSYRRYVTNEVAPSLIKRGLLDRIDDKWLGLFPRTRYVRTPSGVAMAIPFERLMLRIEQLPVLIERDPETAIRLARSAGVLLIMSPKARRQIPALRKLLAERGDDGDVIAYVAIDSGENDKVDQLLDIGDMALEFEIAALFDSIDAVGDLTSSSDSSSDGGDGGGGGGGD